MVKVKKNRRCIRMPKHRTIRNCT